MLHVVVDGRPGDFPEGSSILSALRALDIDVPALCHDDRLQPTGACRSCLVRVDGRERLVPACATPLADGMVIDTATPELVEHRRSLFGLLARRYPAGAAARSPGKEFHRRLREYALDGERPAGPAAIEGGRSHPYIAVDMSRCIDCYRCVRICDEVEGQRVWHVRGRGLETRIVPDGPSLRDSSCVGCGACADTCPTGALDDAGAEAPGEASHWTRTVCPYCGTGCEMRVGTRDGRIVAVRPVLDAPVSKGHLCVKGRYAFEYVHAADRVTDPMIRMSGEWRRVSWGEARGFVANRLQGLLRRYGSDSVGLLGSARATNEDNYVAQKFARLVLGTNNVDSCARVCHAPSAAALKAMLGQGLATNAFDDIEAARTILVCGANVTEAHPVIGARIRQAARRGATLIVIDPRRIELVSDAAHHLAIAPGTNVAVLNAMAHTIVHEDLCDAPFLASRVDGFESFRRFIAAWPPSRAATACRVDAEAIRAAARAYATGGPAITLHGLGLTEHTDGTAAVMALINLVLLTGNLGKPGTGVNPLRGQNNVQGAAHMGCDPESLPGSVPMDSGRADAERIWAARLPVSRGLNMLEMMDAAAAGRLKGLWAIGYDLFLTNPDAAHTARALQSLELLIVQDLFLTETARRFGTVFLPACSSFEKHGTFMNAERRIQRVRAALPLAGASKPDWRIVAEIARRMGHRASFAFRCAEDIWDEVRTMCEGARGMAYPRLDHGGLQWPCPSDDHPGTRVLHVEGFRIGPRAALRCVDQPAPAGSVSTRFPFVLMTGRSLYQFNAGTMTGRTPNKELRPADLLEISPGDAAALGLADGARVRVVSEHGEAELPAHVTGAIQRGQVFATFQMAETLLNAVTGPLRDAVTGTPCYKATAVRVERI